VLAQKNYANSKRNQSCGSGLTSIRIQGCNKKIKTDSSVVCAGTKHLNVAANKYPQTGVRCTGISNADTVQHHLRAGYRAKFFADPDQVYFTSWIRDQDPG
jgi:hypothetical protein